MTTKHVRSIAFFGSGNMTEAMVRGILEKKLLPPKSIFCSNRSSEKLRRLKSRLRIQAVKTNAELAARSSTWILSVKPKDVEHLAQDIAPFASRNILLLSMVAGIETSRLRALFGSEVRIVRAMPNTACRIGKGATGLFASREATRKDRQLAKHLFSSVGLVYETTQEAQMHIVTALSGSGPAYVFYFMEALRDAAIELGLPREAATQLTLATVSGAAQLASLAKEDLAELRKAVTSPGGTTLEGLKALDEGLFLTTIAKAVRSANQRSLELSLEFAQDRRHKV